jgi:hypothetical protein
MLPKPRPAAPTLREAETARKISNVDVEQLLLGESAGGDRLPDVCLLDVPLSDLHPPNIHRTVILLPAVPIPDVPLPEARPDGSVGKE